jgi:hypothetical protein
VPPLKDSVNVMLPCQLLMDKLAQGWTGAVRLFEFLKNYWFWFFKCFRIKQPPIQVLWKNQNERTAGPNYFKSLKALVGFMKNWKIIIFYGWLFDFSKNENHGYIYIYIPVWFSLRTMLMNPKNHPDNHQGSVPVSNNYPMLVWTVETTVPTCNQPMFGTK